MLPDRAATCAAFVRPLTAVVGEAPSTYMTGWRLAIAARRLRETAEVLAAIACGVGYSSEFTFSRSFTPSLRPAPRPLPGRDETSGHGIEPRGYGPARDPTVRWPTQPQAAAAKEKR